LARALVAGGVQRWKSRCGLRLRSNPAKAIMADVPEAVVGIGTILNADDLARVEGIGARLASVRAPRRIC